MTNDQMVAHPGWLPGENVTDHESADNAVTYEQLLHYSGNSGNAKNGIAPGAKVKLPAGTASVVGIAKLIGIDQENRIIYYMD